MDPEISSGASNSAFDRGIDHSTIPNMKSYQVTLNLDSNLKNLKLIENEKIEFKYQNQEPKSQTSYLFGGTIVLLSLVHVKSNWMCKIPTLNFWR